MKKNKLIVLLQFIVLSVLSQPAFSGGYLKIDTMFISNSSGMEGGTIDDRSSRTMMNFSAGQTFSNNVSLGVIYSSDKWETRTYAFDKVGLGLSLGYIKGKGKGPFIFTHYYPAPTMTGGYKGAGYQIDLGYRFQLDKVSIAPQLSKKVFTFNELNGEKIDPAYIDDRIDPYFVMWIDF